MGKIQRKRERNISRKKQDRKPPGVWNLPTVLGLIVGLVGLVGLIALRPQVSVSPMEPLRKSEPFSVPFRVVNSGVLSLRLDHAYCYLHEAHLDRQITWKGDILFRRDWNHKMLDAGEAETVACDIGRWNDAVRMADVVIVVDIRWLYIPWSSRRFFRFQGTYTDNWQWLAQPSSPIRAEADENVGQSEP